MGNFRAKDITGELLQFVRQELGLPLTTGGAPQQFINDLRTANLIETNDHEIFPTNANIWEAEWRLLYCPSHGATRHLSQMPIVSIDNKQQKGHVSFLITLRDSALSSIKVFIGTDRPMEVKMKFTLVKQLSLALGHTITLSQKISNGGFSFLQRKSVFQKMP